MNQARTRRLLRFACAPLALVLFFAGLNSAAAQGQGGRAGAAQLAAIREYISRSWHTLTRSNRALASAAVDPKFKPGAGARANANGDTKADANTNAGADANASVADSSVRWPVYVARDEDLGAIVERLRAQLKPEEVARIELRRLPAGAAVAAPGVLSLPRPYVVPGGRFNEMYGWDSYFIEVGLLRDGETELDEGTVPARSEEHTSELHSRFGI